MGDTLRDDILKSEAGQRMVDRVTPIYNESFVGLWLYEAMGREWDAYWELVNSLKDELFPESTTWMIELWERRYAITPPEDATLEERRQAVLNHRVLPSPISPWRVEQLIGGYTGRDVSVTENVAPYTFAIDIASGENPIASLQKLREFIGRKKPSHLSYNLALHTDGYNRLYAGIVLYGTPWQYFEETENPDLDDLAFLQDELGEYLVDENYVAITD